MIKKQCRTCVHFHGTMFKYADGEPCKGECRRYPPVWPCGWIAVECDWLCGEWHSREAHDHLTSPHGDNLLKAAERYTAKLTAEIRVRSEAIEECAEAIRGLKATNKAPKLENCVSSGAEKSDESVTRDDITCDKIMSDIAKWRRSDNSVDVDFHYKAIKKGITSALSEAREEGARAMAKRITGGDTSFGS